MSVQAEPDWQDRAEEVMLIIDDAEHWGAEDRCRSGASCGLCFTRYVDTTPLTQWIWRSVLGPASAFERTGQYRKEKCDRVAKRTGSKAKSRR